MPTYVRACQIEIKPTHFVVFQFRIATAPFHYVGFADFWLADQLNSLTTVLLDFEYLVCFYAIEVNWEGDNSKLSDYLEFFKFISGF